MPITRRQQHLYAERVRAVDLERPGYLTRWQQWETNLLAAGGDGVVAPPAAEEDLDELLTRARVVTVAGLAVPPVLASLSNNDCHANSARLWVEGVALGRVVAVVTGYALSNDGLWRQHSWAAGPGGVIIETTTTRDAYAGIELADGEALAFAFANSASAVHAALAHDANFRRYITSLRP